ncbi:MAG: HD-GYP domain-containing protein [Rubrivivax sp.]|nr:MAG: HD-GYP domain-containing protein [Rubrivivax sp.]
MLKKIPLEHLRLGMHIHELGGSWINHPFWKSAFKVTEARQLQQLRDSAVLEVWIDTSKGLDVLAAQGAGAAQGDLNTSGHGSGEAASAGETGPDAAAGLRGQALLKRPAAIQPATLREEMARATRIIDQSRGAMKTMFQDVRLGKAIDPEHCLPLVDDITQSVARNPGALVSLARLKTSDDYTYMHSVAVCALMVSLAQQLNLNEADKREAGLAGLVHDLGKALMPLEVLNKPGKLTDGEYTVMRGHPEAGHRLLVEARGVGGIPLDVCLHHHEKVNGTGYPHRLKGDDISLFARMGAVCDVYDAITSNRPYKEGWDPADSVHKMAQWTREGHFDGAIFQAFVKSIGIYPTGSLVKLKSGRLAVVVDQGAASLLTPVLKAFYSTKASEPMVPVLIDLGAPGCGDQIVSRESPAAWGFANLDDFWAADR